VAPATLTVTLVGAHPALSRYLTEKVNPVDVVPVPGVTAPLLSVMEWLGLEQLTAQAAGAHAMDAATAARTVARRTAFN